MLLTSKIPSRSRILDSISTRTTDGTALPYTTRAIAVAAGTLSVLVLNVMPALTGILAGHLGFANADIGTYVSADVLGIALGSALSAPLMSHTSLRTVFSSGVLLLALANLCSAAGSTVAAVTALRFCGGLGGGVALGACFYVFAHGHRERDFAAYNVGGTALAFLVILAIPRIEAHFGWSMVFVGLGLLALPVIALAGQVPAIRVAASNSGGANDTPRRWLRPAEWMALAGTAAFFLGQGSLYTFLERIGDASGFGKEAIEHSLSVFALTGFLACAGVLLLGPRVTGLAGLAAGVLVNLVGALAVTSSDVRVYTVAICVFYVSLPIIATCQFGAIARADPSGRAAVYASTATFGGFAVGPSLGGILVERFGFVAVQTMDIGLVLFTAGTLLPLLRAMSPVRLGKTIE